LQPFIVFLTSAFVPVKETIFRSDSQHTCLVVPIMDLLLNRLADDNDLSVLLLRKLIKKADRSWIWIIFNKWYHPFLIYQNKSVGCPLEILVSDIKLKLFEIYSSFY
jgi:hypothetical protein